MRPALIACVLLLTSCTPRLQGPGGPLDCPDGTLVWNDSQCMMGFMSWVPGIAALFFAIWFTTRTLSFMARVESRLDDIADHTKKRD